MTTKGAQQRYRDNNIELFNNMFKQIKKEIDADPYRDRAGGFSVLQFLKFDSVEIVKFTDRHGRRGIVFPANSYKGVINNAVIHEYEWFNGKVEIMAQGRYSDSHMELNSMLVSLAYPFYMESERVRQHYAIIKEIQQKFPITYK